MDATLPTVDRERRLRRLRHRSVRAGLLSSSAAAAANVVYFLSTPTGPNRPTLWALQGLAIGIGLIVALPGTALPRWLPPRRLALAWIWSQTVIVALAVWLDGGLHSPIATLSVLPLVIGAMSFRASTVLLHGVGSVVGLLTAGAASGTLGLGAGVLWSVTLLGTALMASTVAQQLWRLTNDLTATNRRLHRLARTDALTDCLNHGTFHSHLADALQGRARDTTLALLLLDIDHFKRVNDQHGHPTGDRVLAVVATAIRSTVRRQDIVGRTGGEEFAVLLPDTDLHAAQVVAERVRAAVADVDGPCPVTVSAGLAIAPGHGTTPDALIDTADAALYAAKRSGRDRLVIAGAVTEPSARGRLATDPRPRGSDIARPDRAGSA